MPQPVVEAPKPKVILPADIVPELKACFAQVGVALPDRDLSRNDVARILTKAAAVDRAKSRCGKVAIDWIEGVQKEYR